MIRLSPAIRDRLDALGERDCAIARMRLDGEPCSVIAKRFRLTRSSISKILNRALALQAGAAVAPSTPRPIARKATRYGAALDDAWFARNVAMIQRAAGDEEHQTRYLNGIELLWGAEMRARLAKAAGVDA